MARNGSGTYSLPSGNPVSSGATISSSTHNTTMTDIATALTASIAKDGQTTPTADLPMGNNKHTGVANAAARTDYAAAAQVQDGSLTYLTSVSGTDTITATGAVSMAAYAAGQHFVFVSAGANTGAVTLNVNSIGAKAITKRGTTALKAGDIPSGAAVTVVYDGTQFQLAGIAPGTPGPTVASAQATTSGRSVTFSSIPEWVTQIEITWAAVSMDGSTDALAVRLGDSGGIETSGYLGCVVNAGAGTFVRPTNCFQVIAAVSAATHSIHGSATLTLLDSGANTWVISGTSAFSDANGVDTFAGSKSTSGTLDRVQFLLLGSTDDFDAGSVSIRYS